MDQAWQYALSAGPGTPEFALRHSEVVGLSQVVASRLMAFPEDDETRMRYIKYLPAWYEAVVYRGGWSAAGNPPRNALSETILDHLASLGDRFDHKFRGEEYVITDEAEQQLRANLADWLRLLEEADLPSNLVVEIRTKVHHILWLLDSVGLLGTQPVIDRTRELVGMGFTAMAQRPTFAQKIGAVVVGVVAFLGMVDKGVEHANGILEGTQQIIENVQEIENLISGDAPKELPAPPGPHEVPTDVRADDGGGDGQHEVLDAEVVEDGVR